MNKICEMDEGQHSMLDKSIRKYGAKTVYEATYGWEDGNHAPLLAVGLDVSMLEDASRVLYVAYIAYIAYHKMSAADEKIAC